MERRPTVQATGTWSPTPSPTPSPPPQPPTEFTLSDADRQRLLRDHHSGLKPSSLPSPRGKDPLLVLSPEELARRVQLQEEEVPPLWEQLANALLWTIPFGFLYSAMDYAVHAQFGADLPSSTALAHLLNIVPTIYLLTYLLSLPHPLLPHWTTQTLLIALCTSSGISLVHLTTTESYLRVMKLAPGVGTLWVWSVVRMELAPALLGLVGVGVGVWWRGEGEGVKWW